MDANKNSEKKEFKCKL